MYRLDEALPLVFGAGRDGHTQADWPEDDQVGPTLDHNRPVAVLLLARTSTVVSSTWTRSAPSASCLSKARSGDSAVVQVPIQCQLTNFHMQTRMTRKLANGHYLVPQLLDKVVREYTPEGKIVWEAKTPQGPDDPPECWPFTAIRLPNGHTFINCTHGRTSIEVDKEGKTIWRLSNSDLPEPLRPLVRGLSRP